MRLRAYQSVGEGDVVVRISYEEARTSGGSEWSLLGEIPTENYVASDLPWYEIRSSINKFVVEENVSEYTLWNTSYWFAGLSSNFKEFYGLNNLKIQPAPSEEKYSSTAHMFEDANLSKLITPIFGDSLDVSLNVQNVTDLSYMFKGAVFPSDKSIVNFRNMELGSDVTTFEGIFKNSSATTIDLSR